jgi:hypothetical protein
MRVAHGHRSPDRPGRVSMNLRLREGDYDRLKALAQVNGVSATEAITDLIRQASKVLAEAEVEPAA